MSREALGFSESEWEILTHGPLNMLAHIGGVDLYVDAAEWTSLIDAVHASTREEDALVAAIMGELAESLHRGERQLPDGHEPLDGLYAVAKALDAREDGHGAAYRVALMEIGAAVADASGGGLAIRYGLHHGDNRWQPTDATSVGERRAIEAAALALGLAVPAGAGEAGAHGAVSES